MELAFKPGLLSSLLCNCNTFGPALNSTTITRVGCHELANNNDTRGVCFRAPQPQVGAFGMTFNPPPRTSTKGEITDSVGKTPAEVVFAFHSRVDQGYKGEPWFDVNHYQ
ncbi:hypothetical protein CTI12_AA590490 [Artemisia annua]|uniref:Uncharacterized protein n=1 Tax=Artemisia annua TaxID=35608 RepID=A0A2U1KKX7_ARTAN|nr:hypothetical protein CTI12_AA590490 [Artemisia annua]